MTDISCQVCTDINVMIAICDSKAGHIWGGRGREGVMAPAASGKINYQKSSEANLYVEIPHV